jgi:hypothetical protein
MISNRRAGWTLLALMMAVAVTFVAVSSDRGLADHHEDNEWIHLFNHEDLTGWDTWLRAREPGGEPIGLNNDPYDVYSVVEHEGENVIRISGEVYGAITTQEEYENYWLRVEFKWGEKKWPPRLDEAMDSGILYHCVGPHGAGSGAWMRSLESNVCEGECGDFWSVDGVIVDTRGTLGPSEDEWPYVYYDPEGEWHTANRDRSWIIAKDDYDKPTGEWNVMEVLTVGQTSVHLVNGQVAMVLFNSRHVVDGEEVPLTKGKIQIQSEAAEVFYREIALKPIDEIPEEYLETTLDD